MPYPYPLPTTSPVSFAQQYTSPVYPSLPLLVTQHRGTFRNLLKAYKRLPPAQQSSQLPQLLTSIEAYLRYPLFLQSCLHSGDVLPNDASPKPITTSWRATITSPAFPGAQPRRADRTGLEYEISFTLSTLAYTHTLIARSQLHDALLPETQDDRKQQLLNTSIQHLLASSAIFTYSLALPRAPVDSNWPVDLNAQTLSALSSLSLADATLLAVIKQDPYPSYLSLTNPHGKRSQPGVLYAAIQPPTGVKALLLSRICIAASTHADHALGLLPEGLQPELGRYLDSLSRVARAKACRFLGIDAEASGRVGEGIGWIALARSLLSSPSSSSSAKLKREFLERRESKGLAKGDGTWGLDAGRMEESRVLEALEEKWKAANDRVFFSNHRGGEHARREDPERKGSA